MLYQVSYAALQRQKHPTKTQLISYGSTLTLNNELEKE
jgi:hypothetical protein